MAAWVLDGDHARLSMPLLLPDASATEEQHERTGSSSSLTRRKRPQTSTLKPKP